ncbi:unnamed protein product [Blepharisma stoltei]|uniref:C2H2-type domain-containing protein n=1 Tax=Blepharisma stoltei TaxID=1481888 RepID=A0AAU9JTJ3_9CILI|nr:unnamed protein product [Blepharisma stoltei]
MNRFVVRQFLLPHPQDLQISSDPIDRANTFMCNQCLLSFESATDRDKHSITKPIIDKSEVFKEKPKVFTYENDKGFCEINFADKKKDGEFFCDECNKGFSSYQGLRQHEGKIHREKKRNFKCTICVKKFFSRYLLRSHMKQVHETSDKFSCIQSSQFDKTENALKMHADHCGMSFGYRN